MAEGKFAFTTFSTPVNRVLRRCKRCTNLVHKKTLKVEEAARESDYSTIENTTVSCLLNSTLHFIMPRCRGLYASILLPFATNSVSHNNKFAVSSWRSTLFFDTPGVKLSQRIMTSRLASIQ